MKLSVAVAGREALTSAFVVYRGLEESMKKASDLGFDGVELALKRPDEISRSDLRSLLQSNGLEVSAISSGQSGRREVSPLPRRMARSAKNAQDILRIHRPCLDFGQIVNIGEPREHRFEGSGARARIVLRYGPLSRRLCRETGGRLDS